MHRHVRVRRQKLLQPYKKQRGADKGSEKDHARLSSDGNVEGWVADSTDRQSAMTTTSGFRSDHQRLVGLHTHVDVDGTWDGSDDADDDDLLGAPLLEQAHRRTARARCMASTPRPRER